MLSHMSIDETLIVVLSFQIANTILGARKYVPHSLLSNSCEFLLKSSGYESCVHSNGSLFPFLFIRPNIYSWLGSKSLEGILHVAFAYLIGGHCLNYISFLFVIYFNPSNLFALLYSALTYVEISICPYLGYRIRAYVHLLIRIQFFLCTNTLPHILYLWGLQKHFWLVILVFFSFLPSLIAFQSDINRVFNIMSHLKTSCPEVVCSVVWYMFSTSKAVASNIPYQGSSLSRYLFSSSGLLWLGKLFTILNSLVSLP